MLTILYAFFGGRGGDGPIRYRGSGRAGRSAGTGSDQGGRWHQGRTCLGNRGGSVFRRRGRGNRRSGEIRTPWCGGRPLPSWDLPRHLGGCAQRDALFARGGVTSIISYFRTGSHYLGKSGPFAEIFPEVLEATSGHS